MISFLSTGCEQDNFIDQVEIEQNTNNSQIEYITYKNAPQVINSITSLTGKSSLKTYSFGKGIDYKKAYIDLNSILKVQNTKGIINYSFNILMENAPRNEFYNLIVNEGIKGKMKTPYVIKYVVDEDALEVFMANKRDFRFFKGKQHIMSFDSFFDGFNSSTNRATGDCPEEVVPIDNTRSTGADGNFYNITGDNFLQTDPYAYEYASTVILGDSYEIYLNSNNTVTLENTSFTAIVRDAVAPISFTSQPLIFYNLPGLIGPQYSPRFTGMEITTYYGGPGSAGCSYIKIRHYSDGSQTTSGGIINCPGTINPHLLSQEINSKIEDCTGGGGEIGVNLINSAIDEITGCISLSTEQTNSLYGSLFTIKLKNYLIDENICSPVAKDFGVLAVDAHVSLGEVDFVEEIIYDSSLNNFPCQKSLIEKAIKTGTPLTKSVLDAFAANKGVNLIFKVSNSITGNGNTSSISSYNSTTHTCDITINFRKSYLETATDLSIARTSIHEGLHATLVYLYEETLLQAANGTPLEGFENFVKAYVDYLGGKPANLGVAHHELMSDFVDDIATSLSAYSLANGYSNSFSFYKKLSWAGLTTTSEFKTLYPIYINSNDEIVNPTNYNPIWLDVINTIAVEQNNTTYTFNHQNGTIYEFIPIGNPPNTTEPCN